MYISWLYIYNIIVCIYLYVYMPSPFAHRLGAPSGGPPAEGPRGGGRPPRGPAGGAARRGVPWGGAPRGWGALAAPRRACLACCSLRWRRHLASLECVAVNPRGTLILLCTQRVTKLASSQPSSLAAKPTITRSRAGATLRRATRASLEVILQINAWLKAQRQLLGRRMIHLHGRAKESSQIASQRCQPAVPASSTQGGAAPTNQTGRQAGRQAGRQIGRQTA